MKTLIHSLGMQQELVSLSILKLASWLGFGAVLGYTPIVRFMLVTVMPSTASLTPQDILLYSEIGKNIGGIIAFFIIIVTAAYKYLATRYKNKKWNS